MTHAAFRRMLEDAIGPRVHRAWWHDPTTYAIQPINDLGAIIPLWLVRRTELHHGARARCRPFFLRLDCRWTHRAGLSRFPHRQWGRDCQASWRFPWNTIVQQAISEARCLPGCAEPVSSGAPLTHRPLRSPGSVAGPAAGRPESNGSVKARQEGRGKLLVHPQKRAEQKT